MTVNFAGQQHIDLLHSLVEILENSASSGPIILLHVQ